MHRTVRLKFWLFEHYWWLLLVAVGLTVGTLRYLKEPVATVATVVGALLSVAYFLQKQKLEEMRLFREIFKECNARYDNMNEQLAVIASKASEDLSRQDRNQIVDYLNLCGEEYLYFKRGYVEPSVWAAWQNGMEAVVAAPSIRAVWETERKTGSYYDLPLLEQNMTPNPSIERVSNRSRRSGAAHVER
jgi:predicted NAD/FAD-binding protein